MMLLKAIEEVLLLTTGAGTIAMLLAVLIFGTVIVGISDILIIVGTLIGWLLCVVARKLVERKRRKR